MKQEQRNRKKVGCRKAREEMLQFDAKDPTYRPTKRQRVQMQGASVVMVLQSVIGYESQGEPGLFWLPMKMPWRQQNIVVVAWRGVRRLEM